MDDVLARCLIHVEILEIGFKVVNPIQHACMAPAAAKRRQGDRIALHTGVSLARTLPNGTVDKVRDEVETLIRQRGSTSAWPSWSSGFPGRRHCVQKCGLASIRGNTR